MEARSDRPALSRLSAGLVIVIVLGMAAGGTPAQAEDELRCATALADEVRGDAAVAALGADLAEVAGDHNLAATELRDELRADASLWVDRCGELFYSEPARAAGMVEPAAGEPAIGELTYPEAETFSLHSRPGSERVVYLDFDGYSLSGTAWNAAYGLADGYTMSPFDADRTPGFSLYERGVIQAVWQRVAEDFAPFDVDVTTEDPGIDAITRGSLDDTTYGTRAVITDEVELQSRCSCGGHAYVGVFNRADAHAYYQPALVYTEGVGWGNKNIAEAVSHEVGHNLGLQHDGTATAGYYDGHNTWGPIMGVGYIRPISQWSRGEYAGANNTAQDDLLVIAAHGAPRRADDHGDTAVAASAMESAIARGVITDATDRDWFSFDGGGPLQIMVTPSVTGPNLDAAATLYDADGTVVAQSDPASAPVSFERASGMDARITRDLPVGRYFVEVQGVGAGDPLTTGYSAYGSLGAYQVAVGTPSELAVASASVPVAARRKLYSTTLSALGGTAPYTWRISGGLLPAGITMSAAGVISGTPTTLGTATFEVEVSDALGRRATAPLSTLVAGPITVATTALPMAARDTSYSATLLSKGGGGLKQWKVAAGVLPPGLTLSTAGVISGTTATPGIYRPTVQVTDGAGQIGRRVLTLNVAPLPPARVSRVVAKRTDRSVQVTFVPVTSALRPHAVTHVSFDGVPVSETTGTSVTFNDLTPGQKYRIDLVAEGPGGRSLPYTVYPIAITVPLAPSAPAATTGALVGTGKALLSWTAAPTSVAAPRSGYRIYRDGVAIATTTSTKYTARYLQPGRTYNFEIRSYGVAGEGGQVTVSAVPT